MLIYENIVNNNRQVWGTMGNIPDENSVKLTYKDQEGASVTPSLNYKYTDDGFGGIMMNNGNAEIPLSVFIGNEQVVPTVLAESLVLSGNYKTEFNVGEQLDVSGLSVTAIYKGGREDTNVVGWKTSPSANSILNNAATNKKVTVTYQKASADYYINVSSVNSEE